MYTLKFDKSICASCETYDCLVKCRYLDLDLDAAKTEKWRLINGEDSIVLSNCVTCYACEEYCPYGNHPFYQIVDLQEEKNIYPAPQPITNQQIKSVSLVGKREREDLKDPVISLCVFPEAKKPIKGKFLNNPTSFMGRDYFCNLMYLHFGKSSVIKDRLPKVIEHIWDDKLSESESKQLICYHDECFGAFSSWAPAYGIDVPFKVIYFYEYLFKQLKKKAHHIKRINAKVAYQRPCSNRLCPEQEHWVDNIFELIGVERVKREFDREQALCCGSILRMQGRDDLAHELQKKNIDDMVASGAEWCIFNCPFCGYTLSELIKERNIKPIMMLDLCNLAWGDNEENREIV